MLHLGEPLRLGVAKLRLGVPVSSPLKRTSLPKRSEASPR